MMGAGAEGLTFDCEDGFTVLYWDESPRDKSERINKKKRLRRADVDSSDGRAVREGALALGAEQPAADGPGVSEAEPSTSAAALENVRASEQATWDECRVALEQQLVEALQRARVLESQAAADDLRIDNLAGEIEALRGCVAKLIGAGNLRPDKKGFDCKAAEPAVLAAEANLVVREQLRLRRQFCSLRASSLAHKAEKDELNRKKDELKREKDDLLAQVTSAQAEKDELNREKDDLLGRMASAQEENRQERCRRLDAENRDDCMLCMERPRTVVFQPCMHLVNCKECSVGCKQCPYCQAKVKKMLEVFRP